MKNIIKIGNDVPITGMLSDTTLTFAQLTEIRLKVIINGQLATIDEKRSFITYNKW
jgi:hypothetical protein